VTYNRREHDVRLVTAEHEAGHAVANIVLGHAVHGMFLTLPRDSPGTATTAASTSPVPSRSG
jgi:hypothetical protein